MVLIFIVVPILIVKLPHYNYVTNCGSAHVDVSEELLHGFRQGQGCRIESSRNMAADSPLEVYRYGELDDMGPGGVTAWHSRMLGTLVDHLR